MRVQIYGMQEHSISSKKTCSPKKVKIFADFVSVFLLMMVFFEPNEAGAQQPRRPKPKPDAPSETIFKLYRSSYRPPKKPKTPLPTQGEVRVFQKNPAFAAPSSTGVEVTKLWRKLTSDASRFTNVNWSNRTLLDSPGWQKAYGVGVLGSKTTLNRPIYSGEVDAEKVIFSPTDSTRVVDKKYNLVDVRKEQFTAGLSFVYMKTYKWESGLFVSFGAQATGCFVQNDLTMKVDFYRPILNKDDISNPYVVTDHFERANYKVEKETFYTISVNPFIEVGTGNKKWHICVRVALLPPSLESKKESNEPKSSSQLNPDVLPAAQQPLTPLADQATKKYLDQFTEPLWGTQVSVSVRRPLQLVFPKRLKTGRMHEEKNPKPSTSNPIINHIDGGK